MLQKYNVWKVLTPFFLKPLRKFHLRELSRDCKLAHTSVKKVLDNLWSEKLIIKEETYNGPLYMANVHNTEFKLLKKIYWQDTLTKSGFISYLEDKLLPDCIILFGSCSKGEDTESSDIDLYIQAKHKKIELEKFEKLFFRKINLFFEEDFGKISVELKNNIANGIKLYGYLEAF